MRTWENAGTSKDKVMKMIPNRGMVLLRVLPEDEYDASIGMVRAYAKSVSPNAIVEAVGEADAMGEPIVEVGDKVHVPTSSAEQFEEGDVLYAVIHHSKIRLIWRT